MTSAPGCRKCAQSDPCLGRRRPAWGDWPLRNPLKAARNTTIFKTAWKLNVYWKHPYCGQVRDVSLLMVNWGLKVWNEDLVKPQTLDFPLLQTGWQHNGKHFFFSWNRYDLFPEKLTQINAGQVVLLGYFLCTEVLLHRDGVVCSTFDCGIIGNNNTLDTI